MSHLSQSLLVCTISAISYKISVCDPIPGWHLWYSGCQLSIPVWLYQNIYELSIGLMLINVHIPVSVAITSGKNIFSILANLESLLV
jgi:hypothetical protein